VKSETDGKRDVMNKVEKMPSGSSISPVKMTVIRSLEIATAELEKDRSTANASLTAASSISKLIFGGTFSVRQNHCNA
jgi:hypothetical protein